MSKIIETIYEKDFSKSLLSYQSSSTYMRYVDCNYFRSDFVRAKISNKVYENCRFDNCDASLATFSNCIFKNCTFKHANFSKVTFEGCLIESDFTSIEINRNNYLEIESAFEKASFAEARFISSDKNSKLKNIYFRSVGLKYASFESVIFENFITFSVSFENANISNCKADTIDLTNCSCSYLTLNENNFKTLIVAEAKVLTIIGIDQELHTLNIVNTDDKLANIKTNSRNFLLSLAATSYQHFSSNMQLFEQVNTALIISRLNKNNKDIGGFHDEERINQLSVLSNSDEITNLIRVIFEKYSSCCIENNITPDHRDVTNALVLLDKHQIYDAMIYHSIISMFTYGGDLSGSDISSALITYQLLNYSQKINDKKVLKIFLPDSDLENIKDIEYLSIFTNTMLLLSSISEYENLQLKQGSLIKYISFVQKVDLKKVFFVSFLLGAEFHISPDGWEFNFNLKEIIHNESHKELNKFNKKVAPHLELGLVNEDEFKLLTRNIKDNKDKLSLLSNSMSIRLSTEKYQINDSLKVVSLFSSNSLVERADLLASK